MSTAKELRELYRDGSYNPKPEAVEVVEGMFNNCKYEKVDDKYTRVTIRDMSTIILFPIDCIESKPDLVDALLYYHRSVLYDDKRGHPYETDTEKSLRDVGFLFVEAYLNKYHSNYYEKTDLYFDYYDR